ncbi:hypothetical protein TWF481_004928 [Arthrobotrys musiformis]|uniref:GLEYA adhesin domain-containing protein n=1 Tax=Arthrobotrys musiformis TaxID=47236 RepID=A0AAV9WN42_9PEZI
MLLLSSLSSFATTNAQDSGGTMTITIFQTVTNQHTVTSTLENFDTQCGLPKCDEVTWSPISSSSSPTSATSSTTSFSIPTPGETFFLHGQGMYNGLAAQFDDTTGRVVLSDIGTSRLVSLVVDAANNGLLQNAQDSAEVVFARLNSSANNAAFPNESQTILSVLRGLYHTIDAGSIATGSDYLTEWFWNSTTGELELLNSDNRWAFYWAAIASSRHQQRDISFDLYILPISIDVPDDSALEKAPLTWVNAKSYSSLLPTSSSSPAATTTVTTPTETAALTTAVTTPSSRTTTTTSTSTSSQSTSSQSTSSSVSSSTSSLDAFDAITQFTLESYCTELLSYTPPVVTTSDVSFSTSYYPEFTETSTQLSTATVGRSTSVTLVLRREIASPTEPSGIEKRATPDQLTSYASDSLSSACSKVISLLSSTSTTTVSTESTVSAVTQSTSIANTTYSTTTTTADVTIQTIRNLGYARLSTSNGQNTTTGPTAAYFGYYLATTSNDLEGSCGRLLLVPNRLIAGGFNLGYSNSYDAYQLFTNTTCITTFLGSPPPTGWVNTTESGLNVFDLAVTTSYLPFLLQYDNTTSLATPDYAKMGFASAGTFWICTAVPSVYYIFYYPRGFDGLNGYATICADTGFDYLKFGTS